MPSSKGEPDTPDAKNFEIVGPKHMMTIDWSREEHRRCIAACLAKGTSVHANEKHNALASPWWTRFHFKLYKELKEDDKFMFGAIYKYAGEHPHPSAPAYVIAFRGTMLAHSKPLLDLYHDLKVVTNDLRKCRHFKRACQEIRGLVKARSDAAVWLVGHSLGASLALDVGRHMMINSSYNLPTYLFNPPQVSLGPVISLLDLSKKAKSGLYAFSYKLKYELGKMELMMPHSKRMEGLFKDLSPWIPRLYVHEEDIICRGFIEYFVQRELLVKQLPSSIAKSGMMLSYRDMFSSLLRENKEQPHLLPSARLWNVKKHSHNEDPHALKQWWMPDTKLGWFNEEYSQNGELYTSTVL